MAAARIAITVLAILNVFFFVSGLMLLGASFLPFEIVKAKIDTFAADGEAVIFTEEYFVKLILNFRFIGSILLFIGSVCFINRHWIQRQIQNFVAALPNISTLRQFLFEKLSKEKKIHLCALLAILLVAISIRITYLFQPMRYDESFTFVKYALVPLWVGLDCRNIVNVCYLFSDT